MPEAGWPSCFLGSSVALALVLVQVNLVLSHRMPPRGGSTLLLALLLVPAFSGQPGHGADPHPAGSAADKHDSNVAALVAAGGAVDDRIAVETPPGGERGVFALVPVAPGTVLATIPRAAALLSSHLVAEAPGALGAALRRVAEADPRHPLIFSLFLAHQRHNASSAFGSYLASLPEKVGTRAVLGQYWGDPSLRVSEPAPPRIAPGKGGGG